MYMQRFLLQVKETVHQERYVGPDHFYDLDIGLLVLSKNVNTGPYIMPACIDWSASMEPKHNEVGYVSTRLKDRYLKSSAFLLPTSPPLITSPNKPAFVTPTTHYPLSWCDTFKYCDSTIMIRLMLFLEISDKKGLILKIFE